MPARRRRRNRVVRLRRSGPIKRTASAKPQAKAKPKARPVIEDDRDFISIALDNEDWDAKNPPKKVVLHWPRKNRILTQQFTYDENAIIGNLVGAVQELRDGVNKKSTPCNFTNARQVLAFIKVFEALKGMDGAPLYRVDISAGFVRWFRAQKEALALSEEAYTLLSYEDETIHERWGDAKSIVENHGGVKTHLVGFPNINIPLYPWQAAGLSALCAMTSMGRGAFVCDETGSGKTYTVGAWLHREGHKAVVCCPAGLVEGWVRKMRHIKPRGDGARDLRVYAVDKEYPLTAHEYDVIVVSYAMLRKRGAWPLTQFIEQQDRMLILDEGHFAKNYSSVRTSACLFMAQHAKATVVMTATPLKNRVFELHPLLRMTRRLWTEASREDFVRMYDNEDARVEIADHLKGFMMRRMNKDVWRNAPDYELGEAWVDLSNRGDYQQVEVDFIKWLMEKGADPEKIERAERGKVIVQLNKLRQLSAAGKLKRAIPLIEQTLDAGEQCVVFASFTGPLEAIAEKFSRKTGKNFKGQKWRGSGLITGKVSKAKRQELIDGFMAGKIGVLCIGITAGGMGIDLPIARYGFFLDLPWSPADLEQCTGRLVRLGQTRDCQFIKVLAERTIDQRMEALIHTKAEVFRDCIGDEEIVDRVSSQNEIRPSLVAELIMSYIRDPAL